MAGRICMTGILLAILATRVWCEPPLLEVGKTVTSSIEETDPVVTSPVLALYPENKVRGKIFSYRAPDTGAYRVELRSSFFDPYLIFRDGQGKVLTEDDDGWLAIYPRLILSGLPADRTFQVQACALHGETGPFEIRLLAGEPAPVTAEKKLEDSVVAAKESVEVIKKARGERHPTVINRLDEHAYCLRQLQRFEEAIPVYEEALALSQEHAGVDSVRVGQLLNQKGQAHAGLYEFEQARECFERSLKILEKVYGARHPDTARTLRSLALVHWNLGMYEIARPLMERSLAILRRQFGSSAEIAPSITDLALLFETMGSYEEARPLYEEALALLSKTHGSEHPLTAQGMNSLGLVLKKQGKTEEALDLYDEALDICVEHLSPEHPLTLTIRNNRAVLLHDEEELDEARTELEEILRIREETLGSEHPFVSTSLNNLALLLVDSEEFELAASHLERAVAMDRKLMGDEHPSTVLRLSNLARVTAAAGDAERAFELESQSLAARRAILLRQLPVLSESERFRWVARQHRSLEQLVQLGPKVEGGAEKVYREVVFWKGFVSRGLLQERAWVAAQADPELIALQGELDMVLARMSRVFFDSAADPIEQGEKLDGLRKRRGDLERQIAAKTKRSGGELDVDLDAIRGRLDKRDALIDFVVHGKTLADEELVAFIVRPGVPIERVELGSMGTVFRWIRDHVDSIGGDRGIAVLEKKKDDRNIWDKLAPHLSGVKRVFICPEDAVATLPFDTLPGKKEGSYLIEKYSFIYLQSALDLLPRDDAGALGTGALLVGGVDFDSPTVVVDGEDNTRGGSGDRAIIRDYQELTGTLSEVQTLARQFGRSKISAEVEPLILTGKAASEERVKAEASGKRFVHLATHGFFDTSLKMDILDAAEEAEEMAEDELTRGGSVRGRRDVLEATLPGLLSGVVLAGGNLTPAEELEDGILTAEEFAWLDLRGCQLATLSACQTGLGQAQSGEQLIGLRRSLRLAGARTTITSLWKVNDEATMELMTDFYKRLWTRGKGVHEALRAAQIAQLRKNREEQRGDARPSTWGAFVLDGAWE